MFASISSSAAALGCLGHKRPRDGNSDAEQIDQHTTQSTSAISLVRALHHHSNMPSPHIALLDLGSAITDVLAFLGPADQHKLRCTSAAMCEWFDSAAENGSLAFFVTFAPPPSASPLRWRHATANPRGAGPEHEADHAILPATVTVHLRNYCLSSFNAQVCDEADDAIIEFAVIWLVDDFAFEHKLVVTGLFGIRSISNCFCKGVKAAEVEFKGEGSELRSVGNEWMWNCLNVRSVTFSGFGALEEVGDNWMCNCSHLESITFAGDMPKLKKVDYYWMSSCPKLKHLDLTGFTALEEVGDNWLFYCSGLESLAFAGDMPKLKKIGDSWMYCCSKLQHVDLSGFTALEEVGDDWLCGCSRLVSITFACDLPMLKKVGISWMYNCETLKYLDLRGFTALEEVGSYWMRACRSLESITFAGDMPKLKKVGSSWMSFCEKLKHLDLTGFTALEKVGSEWLSFCYGLESIAFDLPRLRKVDHMWMAKCPKLKQVDLTGLTALEEVGEDWLRECPSLERVVVPAHMPQLRKVGCDKGWTPYSYRALSDHLLYLSKLELEF